MRYLAILWCLLAATPAAADPAFGRWLVENGKAVIELHPCGAQACGTIVWLDAPWDDRGVSKRDAKNPDPKARMRHLCGLRLVTGLKRGGNGAWEDGEIYSTRDGKTFGLKVEPDGPARLTVRGYVGLSILGRSQTWTRDDGRRGTCTTLDRAGNDR